MADPVDPTGSLTSLPVLIRQCRERLTALLAETDPAAAAWVEQVRTTHPATPTVVLAGETNRGKSSLVNALIATPGLSPVDAIAATASYLVLRHGPRWAATAHYPSGPPVGVPFGKPATTDGPGSTDELARLVCAGAGPEPPPRQVDIEAPIPLLARMTLVDTPGVGGLDEAHGALARQAAAAATALLFVLDVSAPITRGELDFLAGLGDSVETVLFALTKIDQHRDWRAIRQADSELLARYAPRFAGAVLHPVSARLFEQAAHAPNPEIAALLRERSGVAPLQQALQQQVSGRAAMLGEANTLRALCTALDGLVTRLQAQQRALNSGDAEAGALRTRRDELVAARNSPTRAWQVRLRAAIQRARVESTYEVARQVRGAQIRLRTVIDTADRTVLEQLPHHVDASLQAMAGQVATAMSARVAQIADTALAELFTLTELAAVRAALARRNPPAVLLHPPPQHPHTAEDTLLAAVGFSGGAGLGRLAVLPLAALGAPAELLVLPVSIVLGLGAGWWITRTRRHAADRAHLRQWLSDVLADARSTLDRLVTEHLIDAELQLTTALEDALARRVASIEEELRDVEQALHLNTGQRSREITTGRTRLTEASAGQAQVAALLGRIRALRDRST